MKEPPISNEKGSCAPCIQTGLAVETLLLLLRPYSLSEYCGLVGCSSAKHGLGQLGSGLYTLAILLYLYSLADPTGRLSYQYVDFEPSFSLRFIILIAISSDFLDSFIFRFPFPSFYH